MDLLFGLLGLWLAAGTVIGSCARVEASVFTPYQVTFYGATFAGALILAAFVRRGKALGFTGIDTLPAAYHSALWGAPLAFAGGACDFALHHFRGVENGVEPLLGPAHLVVGLGFLLLLSPPIRSALAARPALATLRSQLPLLFGLAAWLEFLHLATAFAFDPGAARIYVPPGANGFRPDYFLDTTLSLYKSGFGLMIVIVQTLILMGVAVWAVTRFALRPGALPILFVLGNGMIAVGLFGGTPIAATYFAMSVAAGLVGDALVARSRPFPLRTPALYAFGGLVPATYFGTYFAMTAATGGIWWSFTLALGATVWSAICGLAIVLLVASTSGSMRPAALRRSGLP